MKRTVRVYVKNGRGTYENDGNAPKCVIWQATSRGGP